MSANEEKLSSCDDATRSRGCAVGGWREVRCSFPGVQGGCGQATRVAYGCMRRLQSRGDGRGRGQEAAQRRCDGRRAPVPGRSRDGVLSRSRGGWDGESSRSLVACVACGRAGLGTAVLG